MRYQTKRRTCDAIRWTGRAFVGTIPEWVLHALLAEGPGKVWRKGDSILIATDRDPLTVGPGGWLVLLDTGKLTAMNHVDFSLTYEEVVEEKGESLPGTSDDSLGAPTRATKRLRL